MKEFNKKYDYKKVQENISNLRKDVNYDTTKGNKYNLITSPISITGDLHLGQMFSLTLQDVWARYIRLEGDTVNWQTGFHHSSFLAHVLFNQELKRRKINQKKLSDREYRVLFIQELHEKRDMLQKQVQSLGLSYSKFDFTLNEGWGSNVRQVFKNLFDNQKIIRDKNISYWHKEYQTILDETDVEYVTQKGKKYFIRYFIDTKKHSMVVGTMTPSTIFGDVALAVNPLDKRYRKFVGKKVIIPIINKTVPIVADDAVDMTLDQGVYRVTPTHDKLSLEIAQRHNLPLDNYAIDFAGKFTKLASMFAGKDAKEFANNIVQYLEDISNLESKESVEYSVAICKKTGEELSYMLTDQWFVDLSDEYSKIISVLKENNKGLPSMLVEMLEDSISVYSKRCISRQNKFGHIVPIYKTSQNVIPLTQDLIFTKYKDTKSKTKLLISLVVFSLIMDGYLYVDFDIEELVNILLSPSFKDKTKNVLQVYLDIYSDHPDLKGEAKELSDILISVEDVKNMEDIGGLVDIVDEGFLIKSNEENYIFDLETLIGQSGELETSILNSGFVSSLWGSDFNLDQVNILQSGKNDLYSWILRNRAINLALKNDFDINKVCLNNLIVDKKDKQMCSSYNNMISYKELLSQNGIDTIRLALVHKQGERDFVFDKDILENYSGFLNKLWNASRFIKNNLVGDSSINLEKIKNDIITNSEEVTPFDAWVLYGVQDLIDDITNDFNKNNIGLFVEKLITFVQDNFCDKYLEVIKKHKKKSTNSIVVCVLSDILKLVNIFTPCITEQIWQLMGFDGKLVEQKLEKLPKLPTKNYKIHLFVDIIGGLLNIKSQLGLKKHEPVEVFINASADFIHTIGDYQEILGQIVRATELHLVRNNAEFDTTGYTVDNVIDIKLGLKQVSQTTKTNHLKTLLLQLEQKKDYVQYLRSLISSASSAGKYDIIHIKNKEMDATKLEIEELEHQIKMLKQK